MNCKLALALTILLLAAPAARAESITLSQSVNESSIAFEDSVIFEITLRWDGPQTAYFFDRPFSPVIDRMKVRGFSSSIGSVSSAEGEVTTKKFRYVLIPVTAGIGNIEPVAVSFVSWPDSIPGQLMTEAVSVSIGSPLPVAEETGGIPLIWWLVGAVVILGGGGFIVFRLTRWREPVVVEKSPREQALESLISLQGTAGNDMKKFQTELYKILILFMRGEYKFDATGLGAEELEERLRRLGVDELKIKKICSWLSKAEQDKFRPVSAGPGEVVRLGVEVREFFEKW